MTTITPMMTLDKFSARELAKLVNLIHSYANAGTTGYARIPETFDDDGVYPDVNPSSGEVLLVNSNYQVLINTPYGVMEWFMLPYDETEGTAIDLAEELFSVAQHNGKPLPRERWGWHDDNLSELYKHLYSAINAIESTVPNAEDALDLMYRAQRFIIQQGFIKPNIKKIFNTMLAEYGSDKSLRRELAGSIVDSYGGMGMDTLIQWMYDAGMGDFDPDLIPTISHEDEERYANFMRVELLEILTYGDPRE